MPDPGKAVMREQDFSGEIEKIDCDFIKYVQELVQSICAPDKLIVKQINGDPVSVAQFIKYLQAYVGIFSSGELPKPIAVLEVCIFFTGILS